MASAATTLLTAILCHALPRGEPALAWSLSGMRIFRRPAYDYDLVVVGAGASGMFAAGTAASVGFKTLMIEKRTEEGVGGGEGEIPVHVGGDCTNAACVPSKAVRSVGRMRAAAEAAAEASRRGGTEDGTAGSPSHRWLRLARARSVAAVTAVRGREDSAASASPEADDENPNLDVAFVRDCRFVSDRDIRLKDGRSDRVVSARKFLIATGASPLLPEALTRAAERARVPHDTYRSLLRPPSHATSEEDDRKGIGSVWNVLSGTNTGLSSHEGKGSGLGPPKIVLVGGGATACELGQSLSRLGGDDMEVTIVAPKILPAEDVSLQEATMKVLARDGCRLRLGVRVVDVLGAGEEEAQGQSRGLLLLDDGETVPVDRIIFCLGRTPEQSLASLDLDRAGIAWTPDGGVTVDRYLRSKTAGHVYAAGDCASAVRPRDRNAIHAGWTGFHAARNALLPRLLRSPAVHPCVPRVVYTDPEMASTGLGREECVDRYGEGGFDRLRVEEEGMDRADMERAERSADGNFVELRAAKISGRILGATACGPAAAELINEV